jgi:hypothetical protein
MPSANADQTLSEQKGAKQHQAQAHPARSQDIEIERLAVKEMQQPVIGIPTQIQDPHKAGDTQVVSATAKPHQDQSHPQKGQ